MKPHWYCDTCKTVVDPCDITFSENHDGCGGKVRVVDVHPSRLFRKIEGDYYRETGLKPREYVRLINGENAGIATMLATEDYTSWLERKVIGLI